MEGVWYGKHELKALAHAGGLLEGHAAFLIGMDSVDEAEPTDDAEPTAAFEHLFDDDGVDAFVVGAFGDEEESTGGGEEDEDASDSSEEEDGEEVQDRGEEEEGLTEEELDARRRAREEAEADREARTEELRDTLRARGYRERGVDPPPEPRLSSFDLRGIAEYMLSPRCRNVVVMCGAGISVSAGIPDFRTPGTGELPAHATCSPPCVSPEGPCQFRTVRQSAKVRSALASVDLRAGVLSRAPRRLLSAVCGALA